MPLSSRNVVSHADALGQGGRLRDERLCGRLQFWVDTSSSTFESLLGSHILQMENVVEAANRFTVDIHKTLRREQQFAKKNLFYSPNSLSMALAMTYMGARENTAAQMATVLHWDPALTNKLHAEEKLFLDSFQLVNSGSNELLAANRLFVQKDFTMVQEFVEGTKKFYDAEVALVNYKEDAEGARKEVNQWVEGKTKQKIKNLISEGVFNSLTRVALVNAIYFKGCWKQQFKKEATSSQQFLVSESEKMKVQMMHMTKNLKILDFAELNCQILELPYEGEKLSMLVMLPYDTYGLAQMEEDITYDKLQQALTSLPVKYPCKVEVSLPRFKLTQQFLLNKILEKMGATDMFNMDKADFTGITSDSEKIFVSHVIHKAFVEVNEKGTEAAAATAVVMRARCAMPSPIRQFCVDHPFLFVIMHKPSSAILFVGSVVKPEPSE